MGAVGLGRNPDTSAHEQGGHVITLGNVDLEIVPKITRVREYTQRTTLHICHAETARKPG